VNRIRDEDIHDIREDVTRARNKSRLVKIAKNGKPNILDGLQNVNAKLDIDIDRKIGILYKIQDIIL